VEAAALAMKLLVGIVNFTDAKAYCDEKLIEMMEACVVPFADEIIFVGDRLPPAISNSNCPYMWHKMECASTYAEDHLIMGREWLREYAIEEGFDKMLWQGMDCFWQSPHSFANVMNRDVSVVSAITCARTDADVAIARRFVDWAGNQENIPDNELLLSASNLKYKAGLVPSGFMGADAIFMDRDVFFYPFAEGHAPWYERNAQGRVPLCVEENWILNLHKEEVLDTYVDVMNRVWHCHEDGTARMWKGIESPMSELSWDWIKP
jgi:hypothetical protein